MLALESGATAEPIRTDLSRVGADGNDIVTDYFRRRFTVTELPSPKRLQLRHVVDDGIIVYINGVEAHRFGMPEGPVDWLTDANGHENAWEGPFVVDVENLVEGENVIAVELHQAGATSSDAVFGLELSVVTSVPVEGGGDELSIRIDGANVVIEWDGSATLQSADSVLGPWTDIAGATSGYSVEPTGAMKLYRLTQ